MRRGEIWTAAGGSDYVGKPRPVLIVQEDAFEMTPSVCVCGFTSDPSDVYLIRPLIEPTPTSGLARASRLMVDKIATMRRDQLGRRVGMLSPDEMARVDTALLVFFGLASRGAGRRAARLP